MGNYDGSIKMNTEIETKDLNSQMLSVANAIKRSETEITRLNARMDELANKKIPTSEYAKLQKELETTQSKFEQVAQEVADFEKIGADKRFTPFRMARDEAQELRMKIEEIRGAMFELEENGRAFSSGMNTEEYSKAASKVERLTDDIEVGKKRLSEMQEKQKPVTEEFSRMRKVTGKIAAVLSTVSNTGKKAFRALGNVAKKAFSVVTSGAKHGSGMLSTFTSRLKGLALSLFVFNWLSKGFNAMISGMKSGFTNFAAYSSSFAESVQGMKNALSTLGNQLAAAFAPIVQMVIPWLSQLISAISTAMTYVAQFIAVIGGSSTFTRAKKVQDGYNKSLNDTASAAKKASGALAKFDDLDVLAKKDTGAGAGAAGGAGNLFEEVPVDNRFKDLWKWLKDMWEKSDFYDLGKMLGDKLAEALAKIPWNKIKAQARKIAHSLATLINGFIEGEFDGIGVGWWIGHTLAEGLNTAFEFLNEFVHTLHWAGIGDFIADSINGFTQSIDWDVINDTLVTGAEGLAVTLNNIIRNTDWESLAETVSEGINTLIDTVYRFFDTVDWNKAGVKIGGFLKDAFEDIDFEKLGRTIGKVVESAIEFFKGLVGQWDMSEISGAMHDMFKGIFEECDWQDIAKVILGALAIKLAAEATPAVLEKAGTAIQESVGSAVSEAFTSVGGIGGLLTTDMGTIVGAGSAAEIGLAVGTAIVGGIVAAIAGFELGKEIGKAITGDDETYDSFKWGGEDGFFSTITDDLGTTLKAIEDMMTDFENNPVIATLANIVAGPLFSAIAQIDTFGDKIGEKIYTLTDKFEELKTGISEKIEGIKENIIEIWTSIQEWFTEYWILFTEQIHETWENIVLFFTETWENIQLLFQAFLEFIDTVFVASWQEFWTNAETIFQVFKDALYKLIDAIKELYTGLMKSVKLLIDGDWKGAWDNAKKVFSNFKEKVSGIVGEIKSLLQSFFDWISSMVEAAIEKIKSIGESIGSGISHVFGGGGSGGISAQSDTFEVPALASGDVIRGGNPFLAILGDQPKGQTNVEAPLSTIKQAVREELSGMNYGGGFNPTISLNVDGQEFARLTLNDILNEAARQGYDVSVLGVT